MTLSPKVYTWLCGCFVALGSILFGYDLGVIASVLPSNSFLDVVGHPDDTQKGFIVSLLVLGAFFGCIPSGAIADKYGRRKAIVCATIIFLLGGALQTAARNLAMVMVGRFFAGWGIGQLAHLAPLFQSEIAHSSIRGRLTTLQQFFLGIGALVASFIGYACFTTLEGSEAQWRIPLAIQLVPAIPLALLMHLFPESPRWLAMQGRDEETIATLARLHANGDINDPYVQAEFSEIKEGIVRERREKQQSWLLLVKDKSNFRRLMLGITLQFSVQMTGVSVIQYYSPQIFAQVGISAGTTLLLQSGNSIIALFGEGACILLVDRLGRRWPLIVANLVISLTFIISTAIIAIFPAGETSNLSASYAFVAMTWIFNFAFSSAVGPLSWAYPVEIFNNETRARATAITSQAAWLANFMIAQVSPIALTQVGWRYYLVFAVCGFTNAVTIWSFFPETKGIALEHMDELFRTTPLFIPTSKAFVPSERAVYPEATDVEKPRGRESDEKEAIEHVPAPSH